MDLAEASGQPMIDPDLGLAMVFNGAIYNYPELRGELESLGYRFFSGGDTEVLLKGYHAWGADLLPRLNGMFAFAVWERDRQRLFLARDRLGIAALLQPRPLAPALRLEPCRPCSGGDIASDLDPQALNFYLNFHAVVPAPHTLLEGVKLPPATWMSVDLDGSCEQRTWWTLDYGPRPDERELTLDDWQERVLDGLREAVAIRQRAPARSACCSPAGSIRACWWACCTRPGWTTC